MSTPANRRIIEVDKRRRLGLGQLGHREHSTYIGHGLPDGTIILEPAAIMPASQARFMASQQHADQLTKAIRDAKEHPDETLVDRTGMIDQLTEELGLNDDPSKADLEQVLNPEDNGPWDPVPRGAATPE